MESRTNLVEDQQRTVAVRHILHTLQVTRRWFDEVHRLHDHCGELSGMLRQEPLKSVQVVERKRMRQTGHRFGDPGIASCTAYIPVLPPVVTTASDSVF